jgi:hypothetical protein
LGSVIDDHGRNMKDWEKAGRECSGSSVGDPARERGRSSSEAAAGVWAPSKQASLSSPLHFCCDEYKTVSVEAMTWGRVKCRYRWKP